MEEEIDQQQEENIWPKLKSAAEGQVSLTQEDAQEILSVVTTLLIHSNVRKSHDEVFATISDHMGDGNGMDTDFMQFLASNYGHMEEGHEQDSGDVDPAGDDAKAGRRTSVGLCPSKVSLADSSNYLR